MEEMKRSLQFDQVESAWPKTQYLWALHPVFEWVNDQAGLLYGRQEAPLIGLSNGLQPDEYLFILTGIIPNRKSTPVVDEWFALHFKNKDFVGILTMDRLKQMTKLDLGNIPNLDAITADQIKEAQKLLGQAVDQGGLAVMRENI